MEMRKRMRQGNPSSPILPGALLAAVLGAGSFPGSAGAAEEAKVADRGISVASFVDVGQIVNASYWQVGGEETPIEGELLNRNGIALIYHGTLNEVLKMNIGVGGLFWKPYPEVTVQSKVIQFGPGISEASGEFLFSETKSLKFGFFGYKYNPDATNLGEYLLRSEAYPSLVKTGGWVWMNAAAYQSMGLRFNWNAFDGALNQDFLLFSEYAESPIFDFSPSYVATFKPGDFFELGAGVSLHRWLPIQPSVTTPNHEQSTYIEVPNFPEVPALYDTVSNYYQDAAPAGTFRGMESQIRTTYLDAQGAAPDVTQDAAGNRVYIVTRNGVPDTLRASVRKKLTFKAVELMGRFSLNLGNMFGMEASKTGPFKLFSEAAVLGIENQPYYFEDITNRIPVMFGVHVPTFGLLDLLSFQGQYYKNPWPDDKRLQFDQTVPVPKLPGNSPRLYREARDAGTYKEDDLKWTVFAKKNLYSGLDLYFQAANDHMRLMDPFTIPTDIPVTNRKNHWYYLVRFSWGM